MAKTNVCMAISNYLHVLNVRGRKMIGIAVIKRLLKLDQYNFAVMISNWSAIDFYGGYHLQPPGCATI